MSPIYTIEQFLQQLMIFSHIFFYTLLSTSSDFYWAQHSATLQHNTLVWIFFPFRSLFSFFLKFQDGPIISFNICSSFKLSFLLRSVFKIFFPFFHLHKNSALFFEMLHLSLKLQCLLTLLRLSMFHLFKLYLNSDSLCIFLKELLFLLKLRLTGSSFIYFYHPLCYINCPSTYYSGAL